LNLAVAVSLVMMLAVVALWARSYWAFDEIARSQHAASTFAVATRMGKIGIWWGMWDSGYSDGWHHRTLWFPDSLPSFGFFSRDLGATSRYHLILFPCWLPVALLALLLASYLLAQARQRPFQSGCCQRCGYDLRATPERCPECGIPVGIPVATSSAEATA
jgi:hypothetical protein